MAGLKLPRGYQECVEPDCRQVAGPGGQGYCALHEILWRTEALEEANLRASKRAADTPEQRAFGEKVRRARARQLQPGVTPKQGRQTCGALIGCSNPPEPRSWFCLPHQTGRLTKPA